uniref:CSON005513 protein n=1 Tax=Culicoides sonorensis TaxID=179676 RepID=A0A336MRL5_CULSO
MSESCEMYPDFVVICSFLDIFGKCLENKGDKEIPSPLTLKSWLEQGIGFRSQRRRPTQLSEFLFKLLHCYVRGDKQRCKDIGQLDEFLISFIWTFGHKNQGFWLRDYGFDNIPLKEKLVIVRQLLEFQLDHNKTIFESAALAKGPDIRHEPLGRDCLGNYYWHFVEGKSSLVIKEIVHEGSLPFCQTIKSQAAAQKLIQHITECKPDKNMKLDELSNREARKQPFLTCGECDKKFKLMQVNDTRIKFDNPEWICPKCENTQLLNTVSELFLREE